VNVQTVVSVLVGSAILALAAPGLGAEAPSVEEVTRAIDAGRYDEAVAMVRPLAEAGSAEAQNILGGLYLRGWGVTRDVLVALDWLDRSAAQGNPRAAFNIGRLYATGEGVRQDCDKARTYFHAPAEAGNPVAQVNLANLYAEGQLCVPKDLARAVEWFGKAAERGDPLAQHSLGAMYATGEGVDQDFGRAMQWYRKAADQDYGPAQGMIGFMYENGEGVAADREQALGWYRRAADNGDEFALARLRALEAGTAPEGVDAQMFDALMSAPPRMVAIELNRLESADLMLDLAEQGITIQMGGEPVTPDNVDAFRRRNAEERRALVAAIGRRGSEIVGGEYRMSATAACEQSYSIWAAGPLEGVLTRVTIRQDGYKVTMVHPMQLEGMDVLEVPGVMVEDTLVFADPANSDYLLVGRFTDGRIIVAPDADFILGAWPGWTQAPRRSDLEGCRVTLEPGP
jgi:TPR repeat protein